MPRNKYHSEIKCVEASVDGGDGESEGYVLCALCREVSDPEFGRGRGASIRNPKMVAGHHLTDRRLLIGALKNILTKVFMHGYQAENRNYCIWEVLLVHV